MSISRIHLPLLKIRDASKYALLSLRINADKPKLARFILLHLEPKFESNAI
jgi:hypothetical protein